MSTQSPSETGTAPPAETTTDADESIDATEGSETTPDPAFDAHDSAATFDPDSTVRLPNAVDRENQYVG